MIREARGTIYNDDLLQVNAQTVKYIDADGDVATVRVSQGLLTVDTANSSGVLVFSATNSIGGRSLQVIDLAGRGEFKGTSISVSAEKQNGFPGALDGTPSDGNVDVGFIRAALVQNATLEFTDGIDLGRVVVEGDLGKIVAGDKVSPECQSERSMFAPSAPAKSRSRSATILATEPVRSSPRLIR